MEKGSAGSIIEVLVYVVFFIFLIRLFYMQIIKYEEYREKLIHFTTKIERIPSKRGNIFDRNGINIAGLRTGFRLLREGKVSKEDVALKSIIHLLEHPDSSSKYDVKAFPYRFYPFKHIYSQTIGWTGLPSKSEIEKGINPLERIGKSGIERIYDKILRGKDGLRFLLIDARGRVYSKETRPPVLPERGKDIYLTLDIRLGRYIDSLFQEYPKGCAIVFKPKTGEVLALYSAPGFDLNLLTGITEKEEFLKIMRDTLKPFLNRCIQGIYSPGSIFKIITALIALELGLIDTTEFITCKGRYSFGNRVFKDWKEEGHGKVNFLKAIEVSCDVYFYEISKRIGLKRYIEFLKELNIFKKTEIDLPEEKKGFYPTIDFYIKKYGKYGYGEGNVLNLGIGQGEILMTPMQITLMIGAVALGGKCKKPHVLKDKQTLDFVLKFREENIELVKKGLYRVVNGKKGTGRLARHDRVHIAGKTGTSQNPFGKDHALFSCFFPYEDPDYVVFVLLENAGMGGEKAAPLAGKISKRIIDLYGVK